jgi:hypothetical protein
MARGDRDFVLYVALESGYRGPLWMERLERQFWLEVWRAPVVEAVEESQIEQRFFGPIQATIAAEFQDVPLLNLVLGAALPGAVSRGHLEEALDWIESLGVRCRVPIAPGLPESVAAEDLLNRRGYERTASMVRFARPTSPPNLPEPAGIEVVEVDEFTEGFGDFVGNAFDIPGTAQGFFGGLPELASWRCYVAIDSDERPIGCASMMLHECDYAQLGFAAVDEEDRRRGAHMALLRQRILDAVQSRRPMLFADTEEPLDDTDAPSPGARNLVRAGFAQVATRRVWQPTYSE